MEVFDGGGLGKFLNLCMSVAVSDCCVANGLHHWHREFAPSPFFEAQGSQSAVRGLAISISCLRPSQSLLVPRHREEEPKSLGQDDLRTHMGQADIVHAVRTHDT